MTLKLHLPVWFIRYTLEKIVLALCARHTDLPSDICCAHGFLDPLEYLLPSPVWAYPITENLHVRKFAFFLWGVWPQVIEDRAKYESPSVCTCC